MTLRIVTESKEFESLAGVWSSLLRECQEDNSIYLTHEWVSTWWRYFSEDRKLNLLLIEKEGQVIGIIPLMKTRYGIGPAEFYVLETIGAVNCNYVGAMLSANREEVIAALLTYLKEELAKDKIIVRLSLIPEDSKFLEALRRVGTLFSKELIVRESVESVAPYLQLDKTWDELFSLLGRRRRKILRQGLRTLEKAHTLKFGYFDSNLLEEGLERLFDLHRRRWEAVNIKSPFSNPKMKEFYKDIARQFLEKGWLYFSNLAVNDDTASIELGYIYNQKFYAAIWGRELRYSDYSVGHIHLMYMIKDVMGKDLREIDFLRGGEPYKFYWTKTFRRYIRCLIAKNGFGDSLNFKFRYALLRFHEIRQHSLREAYSLFLLKRREKREKERMKLLEKLR